MHRRHTALSVLVSAVLTIGMLAAPAEAARRATITDLVVPEAGLVSGTVTSSSPYVRIGFVGSGEAGMVTIPADTHTTSFELPTWGAAAGIHTLYSQTCGDPVNISYCEVGVASGTVEVLDVTPVVSWPDTLTIGADSEPYLVTVDDPGGGTLRASYWIDGTRQDWLPAEIAHHGITELPLPDGNYDLVIERCFTGTHDCHPYAQLGTHVEVNRELTAEIVEATPTFVAPDDTPAPDLTVRLHFDEGDHLSVELQVLTRTGVVPGFGSTWANVVPDAQGYVTRRLDLTGLSSGRYYVSGTASYDTAKFGHIQGDLVPAYGHGIEVDATDPYIGAVGLTADVFYPAPDGYQDTTVIRAYASDFRDVKIGAEIVDGDGRVVRHFLPDEWDGSFRATWDGRSDGERIVAAGRYGVRIIATDRPGNVSIDDSLSVVVSSKRLVHKTFTKTVTARGSLVDTYVGKCSTLAAPATGRGWRGSIGFYTATRCRGSVKKTLVSTAHALRVPRAIDSGWLSISAFGGAAPAARRSLAYLAYYSTGDGWSHAKPMLPSTGAHGGGKRDLQQFLTSDRWVTWGAYAALGSRYDIRDFTVTINYRALVAPAH